MSVLVSKVIKKSIADKKGIKSGDVLISVNSHEINDVLDYRFYIKEEKLTLALVSNGKAKKVKLHKKEYDDIGLEFETYLMDKQHRCKNKCVFCFVDQLPAGMRETLYFKDDDSRMSFLFGSYVTLTNLTEHDVLRLIEMHISPVNVSVHTMNPALRVEMMKNKHAGECLSILNRLAEAGIQLNTQLVLCPGINDGKELEYSLAQLEKLRPAIQSIAAVPVGLTKFREGLPTLKAYTKEAAREVISIVDSFGDRCKKKYGTRLAYCADEFYLKAELPMPDEDYYEDYPQLENGVGLWKNLESEFLSALETCDYEKKEKRSVSLVTGVAASGLIEYFASLVNKKYPNVKVDVFAVKNDFFGHSITVAGLVTGQDLIAQLKNKNHAQTLIIPSVMLRSEGDVFLDDVSTEDVEQALSAKLVVTDQNDGFALLDNILGLYK